MITKKSYFRCVVKICKLLIWRHSKTKKSQLGEEICNMSMRFWVQRERHSRVNNNNQRLHSGWYYYYRTFRFVWKKIWGWGSHALQISVTSEVCFKSSTLLTFQAHTAHITLHNPAFVYFLFWLSLCAHAGCWPALFSKWENEAQKCTSKCDGHWSEQFDWHTGHAE